MKTADPSTIQNLEMAALMDFQKVKGTTIFPSLILFYDGDTQHELFPEEKIPFIVDPSTPASDILNWQDEYLDPYWDLIPKNPEELLAYVQEEIGPDIQEIRGCFCYGFSRNTEDQGDPTVTLPQLKPWWQRLFSKEKTILLTPSPCS